MPSPVPTIKSGPAEPDDRTRIVTVRPVVAWPPPAAPPRIADPSCLLHMGQLRHGSNRHCRGALRGCDRCKRQSTGQAMLQTHLKTSALLKNVEVQKTDTISSGFS